MSKEQQLEQQPAQQDAAAPAVTEDPTHGLRPDLYAAIQRMSPADWGQLADMMDLYPSFLGAILAVASPHLGNAAVQRAIALVKQKQATQGRSGSLSQDELRESVGEPADSRPVKSGEMTSFLHDASDGPLQTGPDAAPRPAAAEPAWVASARAYNAAHSDLVDEFDDLTHHAVLLDGDVHPRSVARWQADHGLAPDGKIGPHTVQKAREVNAKAAQVAAAPQADARPPV